MKSTMLNSVNGNRSSKRVMGTIYLSIGLFSYVLDQFTSFDIPSYDMWVTMIIVGASLLGISLFEYFGKYGSVKKDNG